MSSDDAATRSTASTGDVSLEHLTPDETYWHYCARGELRLQHCATCGAWQFPPAARCRKCLGRDLPWEQVSGNAIVWSWIRMHKKYFADPAFQPPYLVAMVELEEGPRMISSVDTGAAADPQVGEQLRLTFDEGEDAAGHRLPRFTIEGAGR